ncbi:MAG: RepB family plasmid replication initiator protein, partial [Fusobacteriaceae bacterium]
MKFYCHSVLASARSEDKKIVKNGCAKIILNIFFKAQTDMKREIEKILSQKYSGDNLKNISKALFTGAPENVELKTLKEKLRVEAVKRYSQTQKINLTKIAKENNLHITRIRDEILNLEGKKVVFNCINRKKIQIELTSEVVRNIAFELKEEGLVLHYEIPEEILKLLIFPDQYATIDMKTIKNLKSKYAIKLYILLLDHKKRGVLELSKSEISECFSLPSCYSKNRKTFLDKFLHPTLKELKDVADLKLSYDFKKEYSFHELEFKIGKEQLEFSKKILDKIEFAKRNRFFKKAWDKKSSDFLLELSNSRGDEFVRLLLQNAYERLKSEIKS